MVRGLLVRRAWQRTPAQQAGAHQSRSRHAAPRGIYPPLQPGRVCVMGHFGQSKVVRAWIALARFDAQASSASCKVFQRGAPVPPDATWGEVD
jgi:hypothetical protein